MSRMVTIDWQEEELPDWSVTIRVTEFAPRLMQEKEFGLAILEVIVQLSVEELSN